MWKIPFSLPLPYYRLIASFRYGIYPFFPFLMPRALFFHFMQLISLTRLLVTVFSSTASAYWSFLSTVCAEAPHFSMFVPLFQIIRFLYIFSSSRASLSFNLLETVGDFSSATFKFPLRLLYNWSLATISWSFQRISLPKYGYHRRFPFLSTSRITQTLWTPNVSLRCAKPVSLNSRMILTVLHP